MSNPLVHSVIIGDSGPPLVMLHGWMHNLENLRGLGEILADRFTVHLIDLPGFGESPALAAEAGLDEYVTALAAYLDSRGLSRVTLFGHSFGGRVSIKFAARFPERVERLILNNTPALPPARTARQKLRSSAVRWLGKLAKFCDRILGTALFVGPFTARFGSVDYRNAGVLRTTFVKVVNERLDAPLRRISAPTLLLWGADDRDTPADIGERTRAIIASSTLIVMPKKGHTPFDDVGAHLCAFHIYRWLEAPCAAA